MLIKVKLHEGKGSYSSAKYTFRCDLPVKQGDLVMVETTYGPTQGLVTDIGVSDSQTGLKPGANIQAGVMLVISLDDYNQRKRTEEEINRSKASLWEELKRIDPLVMVRALDRCGGLPGSHKVAILYNHICNLEGSKR